MKTRPHVRYCAYGEGEKPKLYGWEKNLADPALWEIYDPERSIRKLREPILDCGTLVFGDRAAYRMIHTVALDRESCPEMYENTYVRYLAAPLGQYGANRDGEPPNIVFDENAEHTIRETFGDRDTTVYAISQL